MNEPRYTTPKLGAYFLGAGFIALVVIGIFTVLMPEIADDKSAQSKSTAVGVEPTVEPELPQEKL